MNGATTAQRTTVTYDVPEGDESWELAEEDVPETAWHDAIIELIKLVLRAWAARTQMNALICSNVALRWRREQWKVGVDPDVALCIPAPPEGEDTTSICTWQPGHAPPRIAVEVVSRSTASKDYLTGPDQYASSGTNELWIFDPKRFGPKLRGGPFVLQVWRRDETGSFRQVYRGKGPFQSPELGAWLVVTDGGMRLRLADDPHGTRLWPTAAEESEQERARAEQDLARAEQERALAEQDRARAEQDRARAEQDRARAEQDRALADQRTAALETEISSLRAELERLRRGA